MEKFYSALGDHGLVGWLVVVELVIHGGRCNFDVSMNTRCMATNGWKYSWVYEALLVACIVLDVWSRIGSQNYGAKDSERKHDNRNIQMSA